MGRPSKKIETSDNVETADANVQDANVQDANVQDAPEIQASNESGNSETINENEAEKVELPPRVLELMRLYPQYEKLWITSRGFVHPEGAPKYLLKDAKLYKNKFYNK